APAPSGLATPELPGVPLAKVQAWRDLSADAASPGGGSARARALLARFFAGASARYAEDRDRPDRAGTSRLSAHLHFGTISARAVRTAAQDAWRAAAPTERECLRRFVLELAWRDFYHHVLFHFPRVAGASFRPDFDRIAWKTGASGLDAWKAGRTGYPLVDAAMRELATTHWMHNRARMVAASFLTKDLHVHWREGETWFEHELADADLASNNGGWQWAAGSGTDAAPYWRVFHPVLQSKRFDPDGTYIRRFIPELSRVPADRIHEPWLMSSEEQADSACRIGEDYPAPVVDHAREKKVALAMFETLRK
ncbi:MAG TPA: FAD-binding domain-containing protein, partial [Thermoanaerobaculia bacterium]